MWGVAICLKTSEWHQISVVFVDQSQKDFKQKLCIIRKRLKNAAPPLELQAYGLYPFHLAFCNWICSRMFSLHVQDMTCPRSSAATPSTSTRRRSPTGLWPLTSARLRGGKHLIFWKELAKRIEATMPKVLRCSGLQRHKLQVHYIFGLVQSGYSPNRLSRLN